MSDIRDVAAFTAGWDGFYQVSPTASAYSSIELQADDKIAFFYEETLTKWGTKPNPVSTSFPTGAGTHNYDGFENIYVPLELELITGGRYSVCRDVDRGEYLRSSPPPTPPKGRGAQPQALRKSLPLEGI